MAWRLRRLEYALSAETSLIENVLAVVFTSSGSCGASAVSVGVASTLVTMCVLTPHIMCVFIHFTSLRILPHLWSNHRLYVLVENPEESTAKSVSIALSGLALCSIRDLSR